MMTFEEIKNLDKSYLYAGDLKKWQRTSLEKREAITNKSWIGLTLPNYGEEKGTDDENHILFDITHQMPLKECSVDIYQSEDVHEHIGYELLVDQINDIYRVLKPGGLFRLSLPDYNLDILRDRTEKDSCGNLIFDSFGGGYFDSSTNEVKGNGHVWFPTYDNVKELLGMTKFTNIQFLQHWWHIEEENCLDFDCNCNQGSLHMVLHPIDYTKGFVFRTPDHDSRVMNPRRPMSIVVDCIKEENEC